jgi:hypothetical protein
MKIKKNILFILLAIDLILIIISQNLLYLGENDSLSDRGFVGNFETLALKTNLTDGQKEKIIKEFQNKIIWEGPKENLDGIIIFFHIIVIIPLIVLHAIFFIVLIVFKIKNQNIKSLITFNLISLISLIFPILFTFGFIENVIKPINLTEKDYTTTNIEFNKLIRDKIYSLNVRTVEFIISSAFLIVSAIITFIVLVIIIIEEKTKNNNIIPTIESSLVK